MKIVTLTINPALDKSTSTERLVPEKKIRCNEPTYEPGGGGINVSRAIKILGGDSLTVYAAGGASGNIIEELLNKEGVQQLRIKTKNPTRENFMVMENSTGNQFRFGMPGNGLDGDELENCLEAIEKLPKGIEYLVASGSLPPAVDSDFYKKVAEICERKDIKCIIDTSGKALLNAAGSGVYMMKPNLGELSELAGKEEISGMEQEQIAKKVINEGKSKILVVSLGPRGAMIVTKESIEYVTPPTVKQNSTVGAGDSMVAGIILSLSRGEDLREAVRWGVAAGTAATITPGTELCRKEDVNKIFAWISDHSREKLQK